MKSFSSLPSFKYAYLPFLAVFFGIVASPGLGLGWMAWVAYLPILLFVNHAKSKRTFLQGAFFCEFLKWVWCIVWLRHVSWFPVVGISFLMGVYQSLWFWVFSALSKRIRMAGVFEFFLLITWMSLLWAGFEWSRSFQFGIPGMPVAITQWEYPTLLATVSFGGSFLLSGLIVFVNLVLYRALSISKDQLALLSISLISVAFLLSGFAWLKHRVLENQKLDSISIDVAFVQPNQPAYLYWNNERIVQTVEDLFSTTFALPDADYDLLLWPEGALPLSLFKGSDMDREVSRMIRLHTKTPLLMGNQGSDSKGHFNGVFCYDKNGELSDTVYKKRILVPFGEYIPFRNYLGFVETIVPLPDDFQNGNSVDGWKLSFDEIDVNVRALICYEDCFPFLAKNSMIGGTDLLYVATYNVWYGEELGAYVHAAHSVLRAAETSKPVLRCGSAGWSGYIDNWGRVLHVVEDKQSGSIYFRGADVAKIDIPLGVENSFFVKNYRILQIVLVLFLLIVGAWVWSTQRPSMKNKPVVV